MASPFLPPPPPPDPVPTLEQVVNAVLNTTRQAFANQKAAYMRAQSLIWASQHYSGEQIIAAIGAENAQLVQIAAILAKTTLNYAVPGTIVDTVPEATVTMPR